MLTKVILDGAAGKKFGRVWELEVSSVREAVRLIDVNKPGFISWVSENLDKYPRYKVIVKRRSGQKEHLGEKELEMSMSVQEIRIVPVIAGAGGVAQTVGGLALVAIGALITPAFPTLGPALVNAGVAIALGGIIASLTSVPLRDQQSQQERKDRTSYYFDGPVNTSAQGVPVPLIYGRCLVGSQVVSASVTIDQLI